MKCLMYKYDPQHECPWSFALTCPEVRIPEITSGSPSPGSIGFGLQPRFGEMGAGACLPGRPPSRTIPLATTPSPCTPTRISRWAILTIEHGLLLLNRLSRQMRRAPGDANRSEGVAGVENERRRHNLG